MGSNSGVWNWWEAGRWDGVCTCLQEAGASWKLHGCKGRQHGGVLRLGCMKAGQGMGVVGSKCVAACRLGRAWVLLACWSLHSRCVQLRGANL